MILPGPWAAAQPLPPVSVRHAAKILGVSMSTVRSLIACQKLSAFKIGVGRARAHFRIHRRSLDQLLSADLRR